MSSPLPPIRTHKNALAKASVSEALARKDSGQDSVPALPKQRVASKAAPPPVDTPKKMTLRQLAESLDADTRTPVVESRQSEPRPVVTDNKHGASLVARMFRK